MSGFGEMNVLIVCSRRPFQKGSAHELVRALQEGLKISGIRVDVLEQPLCDQPLQTMLHQVSMWRMLDLRVFNGSKIDALIAINFPACAVQHPFKISWFTEDFEGLENVEAAPQRNANNSNEREAGSLSRTEYVRQMLLSAFQTGVNESRSIVVTGGNPSGSPLASRIHNLSGVQPFELLPPLPQSGQYRSVSADETEKFLVAIGEINSDSRFDLLVQALTSMPEDVGLKIVSRATGNATEIGFETYLKSEIDQRRLWSRVEFIDASDTATVLDALSRARGVFIAPKDSQFSFAPFEAFASGRPVITTFDSAFANGIVRDEQNGLVVEANAQALSLAWKRLLDDRSLFLQLQENALQVMKRDVVHAEWSSVLHSIFGQGAPNEKDRTTEEIVKNGSQSSSAIKTISLEEMLASKAPVEKVETAEVFFKREANS